jgi:hypothetical protein
MEIDLNDINDHVKEFGEKLRRVSSFPSLSLARRPHTVTFIFLVLVIWFFTVALYNLRHTVGFIHTFYLTN